MARVSDYAARTARAQAAGYSSLAAQRTAQAHARGYSSRQAETIANKQPTVQAVIQNFRDQGIKIREGAERRMVKQLSRQSYRKLNEKKTATYSQIIDHASNGDDDGWFYH